MRYSNYRAVPEAANSPHHDFQAGRSRDCTPLIMKAMASYLRNGEQATQLFSPAAQLHKNAA
ncbi:MAG: hypothetical protein ACR2O0_10140 [Rhizobiaceae bacterium]